MADAENARLRAELEATRAQLAQSQAANAAARPGEVAVPIAEGVPAPGEATPLTGQPLPRQHSVIAMGKAVQDNKLAAGSSSQTCMGILFAIACLYIYYINGGDQVKCSTKLPFFLKVNGFASIAYILTTAVLVYLSTRGKLSSESASFRGLACITSLVGCFLFAWFICGLVRPRHFEQLKLGLGLGLGAGLGLGLGLRLGLRPRPGLVLRTVEQRARVERRMRLKRCCRGRCGSSRRARPSATRGCTRAPRSTSSSRSSCRSCFAACSRAACAAFWGPRAPAAWAPQTSADPEVPSEMGRRACPVRPVVLETVLLTM